MATALVLGCGDNVWDDANRALEMFTPDAVFAVKDMIYLWPRRLDYAVTLHPDRMSAYITKRKQLGYPLGFEIWAHKKANPLIQKAATDWAGSSGLFAVRVAIQEEFTGVVCAGVPMDRKFGHIARKKDWVAAQQYHKGWMHRLEQIKPIVRSLSGWTKELLGEPTPEWLRAIGSAPPERDAPPHLRRQGDAHIENRA